MSKMIVISFPYEPMIACHINFLNDEILNICTMSNVGSTSKNLSPPIYRTS